MKELPKQFEEYDEQFEQVYRTQATYRQSGMLHVVTLVPNDAAAAFIWKQGGVRQLKRAAQTKGAAMNFHATDESCRFRSFAEAERYAAKSCEEAEQKRAALLKMWASYGVYVADGRVCYSPPKDGSRIKRMCLACRRRKVSGRAYYCDDPECIRVRTAKKQREPDEGVLKPKVRLLAPSGSSTYGGS